MFSRRTAPASASAQKSSAGYWLAVLAGLAAGMTGLWALAALIWDLFDPGAGDQAIGWRLLIGLVCLTGPSYFSSISNGPVGASAASSA
ncbi:hypothetical protein BH18ACT5_BH18ACT5_01350 [soil metagenome]